MKRRKENKGRKSKLRWWGEDWRRKRIKLKRKQWGSNICIPDWRLRVHGHLHSPRYTASSTSLSPVSCFWQGKQELFSPVLKHLILTAPKRPQDDPWCSFPHLQGHSIFPVTPSVVSLPSCLPPPCHKVESKGTCAVSKVFSVVLGVAAAVMNSFFLLSFLFCHFWFL